MTQELESHYTEAFYAGHAAGCARSARHFLLHLFAYYRPSSIVDIGAGVGAWLATARQLGVSDVLGVDGDWVRNQAKLDSAVPYQYMDLEQPIHLDRRFELAMSVEVAEHLHESRARGFVQDLTRASDVVLFGAAMKNQGGENHINEQDQTYWIKLFHENQYQFVDFFRAPFWRSSEVDPWYIQNTFMYIRRGHPALASIPTIPLLEVHHPCLLFNPVQLAKYGIKAT